MNNEQVYNVKNRSAGMEMAAVELEQREIPRM